jgi:ribonuclease HII
MFLDYNSGVDEAGRGCVLGPLVMGLCTLSHEQEIYFKKLGVKDSKLLSKKKRVEFFSIIQKNSIEYKIMAVPAEELNVLMNRYSLNEIEAMKTAEMVKSLKIIPKRLILDCPDTQPEKYKQRMISNFNLIDYKHSIEIISEHKADLNHMSVSCASVLAKVTRDRLINEIIGYELSGYPADPKTIKYIKDYILEHKKIPPFARDKWATIQNIINDLYQKKMGWFNEKK